MNCREAERLIDTFYDGELDGRTMRDAAMHITRCKRCEIELSQRERVQKLLSSAIDDELAGIDLGQIWAAVEPTLELTGARGRGHLLGRVESPRLAAASARVGGLLLGRRSGALDPDADDGSDLDPSGWATPGTRTGRSWRWPLAGGAALAASVLLAVALVPGGPGRAPSDGRLQASLSEPERGSSASTQSPAQIVAQRAPASGGSPVPFDLARADLARPARAANKQVQVESVNFPRSSVAMWSEPATETTVIWIEDEEQAASGRR